jgi:hypothetical protein
MSYWPTEQIEGLKSMARIRYTVKKRRWIMTAFPQDLVASLPHVYLNNLLSMLALLMDDFHLSTNVDIH